MNQNFQDTIQQVTNADEIIHIEDIQSLWSGYGKIMRYGLKDCDFKSVVVKHVKLPDQAHHPRGWGTDISHQRKIKSYKVESAWYHNYAKECDTSCRIPDCLGLQSNADEFLMVLEDLDASGFSLRKNIVTMNEMHVCLSWLANFHATFIGREPIGLWQVGTYWHLDTRPDELAVLDDNGLKKAAYKIDETLNNAQYQTFVHGDAKLANFCFSENATSVAAVDFQYIGGGCGIKDVAYFIGSCLNDADCEQYEKELLDNYFSQLRNALMAQNKSLNPDDIEKEWRELYPLAWTDFHRFLKGWSPEHWKINSYSERIANKVVAQINDVLDV